METYQEFLDRIGAFEKKEVSFGDGYFRANPSLAQKVGPDNRFRPFFGDTVVFDLEEATKGEIAAIAETLHREAGECFCEKLATDTFHMTLHDLSNAPLLETVAPEIADHQQKVRSKAEKIGAQTIKMKTKAIFNMVNTSLVLGLYPANEEEYQKLMAMYMLFDDVKKLPYPFTPHITLAYYNPKGFAAASAKKLERTVRKLNESDLEICLTTRRLFYQVFSSMNEFTNVLSLSASKED